MEMKRNAAYISAKMSDSGYETQDYEVDMQIGGEVDELVIMLGEIIDHLSEGMHVSAEKIVNAAMTKDPELFEKNLAEVFEEYLNKKKKQF